MTKYICCHCGELTTIKNGLTVPHTYLFPLLPETACPGSWQYPRNAESDGRPLWNGKSNRYFYRNREEG